MASLRLRSPLALPLGLALSLAWLPACNSKSEGEGASSSGDAAPNAGDDDSAADTDAASEPGEAGPKSSGGAPTTGGEEPDDPRAAALTITKSEAAAATGGKGVRTLGFNLEKISHLFALQTTPKLPDWGHSGTGEAKLARDDDMNTAWQCEFGQDSPCVLGLAMPETAKVEALRLYTAAGPRYRDYKGHPRVAKVRVHTDAGYVDAELRDGANHGYVRFDQPIETQSLAIEVLGIHEGNKDPQKHQIQLAEVEVYGTDGVPRPPLSLDPSLSWTAWETTTWSGEGDHTIRQIFVNFARPQGQGGADEVLPRRRFARATAAFGQLGDDYALFERLHGTTCDETEGNYVLFDKRNRMYYPLGDLGGAGGQVYRHASGHGFAVGWTNSAGQFTVKGIVEEGGKLKWKRPPKDGAADAKAVLAEWGFDSRPLDRGVAHGGAVAGCHRAGGSELEPVITAAKLDSGAKLDPAAWMICSVGGDTLYASAPCGAKGRAYLLDSSNKLIESFEAKDDDARGLRLRRVGDRLFVELSRKDGDTATLLLATAGKLEVVENNGGLVVRPPSGCTPCEDSWQNPEGDEDDPAEEIDAPKDTGAPDEDIAPPEPEQPAAPPTPTPPG